MKNLAGENRTVMCMAAPAGINSGWAVGRYSPNFAATAFISAIILCIEKNETAEQIQ